MERQRRKSERGIGLVATAVWIMALAIIMAAAVDMARLSHTASEVQVIADAAALSGARALYLNSGAPGPEQTAAWTVANQNSVDGKVFPASNDTTGSMIVEPGSFDSLTGFLPLVPPMNAVRARPTAKSVPFIAASIIGDFLNGNGTHQADVTKEAIAAFGCGNNCAADLPLVICSDVVTNLSPDVPCTGVQVPVLNQIPSTGNSCFSSLSLSSANANTERGYLPPECGGRANGGPIVTIGQQVLVQNGAVDPVLADLQDCVKPTSQGGKNRHIFRIAVIDNCGNCNGSDIHTINNFVALRIGCTDATCTRDNCPCAGASNTWDTAVVANGPTAHGIFNAVQVCDTLPCSGITNQPCGGIPGFGLVVK